MAGGLSGRRRGSLLEGGRSVQTLQPRPDPEWKYRPTGEVIGSLLDEAGRDLATAGTVAERAATLSSDDLTGALGSVDRLRTRTETLMVQLCVEALARGVHLDSGLGSHDWLALQCPWLSRSQVSDVVTVAEGMGEPGHERIRAAVLAQQVPLRRAAMLLRVLRRVRPATDGETYASDVGLLLAVATDPRFTDRDLRTATDRLISVALPERDLESRARAVREMRGVNESSLADGSLVRFVVTCEESGAAMLRGVLASSLAAPIPDDTGPDPRTGSQRRYDALMTVLGRGVAGGDSVPATPKARVIVTVPFDVLGQRLAAQGTTLLGDVLSPGTVRRLACDADLVPMVLGTDSEVLDLGRTRRLVTPGQRVALSRRDQGCSFPGCTVPAAWCEAHHVRHWSRGGSSDLANYALLCPRHHTVVHERDLTATVSATGVTWHV